MLYNEDCKETMKKMEENSIPFIITDPPYLLNFMGKEFDSQHQKYEGKNEGQKMQRWHEEWVREAYRVLKPGGYLVAFGGSRTSHRLTSAMEDVGFEIRDTMQWIYGSGFPKSLDISKAIDKKAGVEREVIGTKPGHEDFIDRKTTGHIDFKGATSGFDRPWMHDDIKREKYHQQTAPSTDKAKHWDGWGTALKPAYEPIIIGMKPVDKSFVNNALEYGVAGMNIDDSRVKTTEEIGRDNRNIKNSPLAPKNGWNENSMKGLDTRGTQQGRWPSNIILQHHPECELIGIKKVKGDGHWISPTNKGLYDLGIKNNKRDEGNKLGEETIEDWNCPPDCPVRIMNEQSGIIKREKTTFDNQHGDSGGSSRFFYTAKASKGERNLGLDGMKKDFRRRDDGQPYGMNTNTHRPDGSERKDVDPQENFHPTVKPVELMMYLVKMFSTPEGGTVYDPFTGSGSTLVACKILNRDSIGSEIDEEYYDIAKKRLEYDWESWYKNNKNEVKIKPDVEVVNTFFDL